MAENTATSLHSVNTEIDRYIIWPGQVGACFSLPYLVQFMLSTANRRRRMVKDGEGMVAVDY